MEQPHYHIVLWYVPKAGEAGRRQMILARRGALRLAGVFATLSIAPASAAEPVIVRLRSDPDGSHVGFDPIGLLIQAGSARALCL